MTLDEFAPQVSFFFYTHGDFFEEIAKYRAGRRRWAHILRERYGATDDPSRIFSVGCVAGGGAPAHGAGPPSCASATAPRKTARACSGSVAWREAPRCTPRRRTTTSCGSR